MMDDYYCRSGWGSALGICSESEIFLKEQKHLKYVQYKKPYWKFVPHPERYGRE